jgi:hypothetical protein
MPFSSDAYRLLNGGSPIPKLNVALQLCDTFELSWKPEHCAERTMRAREEAGIEHVFLFPLTT